MKKPIATMVAIVVTASLGACSTSPQTYPGPQLPAEQVSTLIVGQTINFGTSLALMNVDDKPVSSLRMLDYYKATEFTVLPGPHELVFDTGLGMIFRMPLTTLPGHRYDIKRTAREQVTVVDETTGVLRKFNPVARSYGTFAQTMSEPAKPISPINSVRAASTAPSLEMPNNDTMPSAPLRPCTKEEQDVKQSIEQQGYQWGGQCR